MAKCKDCIHSEVCDQSSRMMWAAMSGKTECDDFKDRSRYVVREKGEWDRSGYCSVCDFWTCYCGDYNFCPNYG